jgi:hypothetical protein
MNAIGARTRERISAVSDGRRRKLLPALLAVGLLPGCGGRASRSETTGKVASADLPEERAWSDDVPFDAIVAGADVDGSTLLVCRAEYEGGVHPGKTRADRNVCYIGWGGREIALPTYQTLKPDWVPASGGAVPDSAVDFGCEFTAPGGLGGCGPALYSCRAYYGGGLHPGKIRPGFDGCYIPYANSEIHVASYEVLADTVPLDTWSMTGAPPSPPYFAVVGGYDTDGAPLYPCIASYQSGRHPGKTRSDWGTCDVSWGGGEHWIADYGVLVPRFIDPWLPSWYPAGHEADGRELGICHASAANSVQVGKYLPWAGTCNFGFNGTEIAAVWEAFTILGFPPQP